MPPHVPAYWLRHGHDLTGRRWRVCNSPIPSHSPSPTLQRRGLALLSMLSKCVLIAPNLLLLKTRQQHVFLLIGRLLRCPADVGDGHGKDRIRQEYGKIHAGPVMVRLYDYVVPCRKITAPYGAKWRNRCCTDRISE